MSKQAKLGDPTDFSYRIDKVIKVVDGDTIDVMIDLGFDIKYKSRVRLFGIDTPESRTRDLTEKKYGLLSKKYLQSSLASGSKKIIKTHKDQETGKFGRILGELYVYENVGHPTFEVHYSINQKMIDDHHAVDYAGGNKEQIQEQRCHNQTFIQTTCTK